MENVQHVLIAMDAQKNKIHNKVTILEIDE